LYHTDLWPEFKELLLPLSKYIKLYIGLCKDNATLNDFDDFDHQLSLHENYGADVASFLHQLAHIDESVFIKIHSKKSSWGFKYHVNWRQMILHDVISSKNLLKSNLNILFSKEDNSVLCNKILLMDNREFHNSAKIEQICNIINIDYSQVKNSQFMAGNMFMGKTSLYQKYITPHIEKLDRLLYNEKGKVGDTFTGTYSHSMERIFGYIVKYENLKFCHPKHPIIKVLNPLAPNKKYFRMIKMYNNFCYLLDDPNVYGFVSSISKSTCSITWLHINHSAETIYDFIDSKIIQKRI
jgi:hypothetical protein